VLLYRRLLMDGRFDSPTMYASLCDEVRGMTGQQPFSGCPRCTLSTTTERGS
jgi:hypothetical protein